MKNLKAITLKLAFFTTIFISFLFIITKNCANKDLINKNNYIENDICNNCKLEKVFFSPDDNISEIIVDLIENEKESIKIAIYTFTNNDISNALIRAYKKGIKIEIITDISSLFNKYSKIKTLLSQNIDIWSYDKKNSNSIMHDKFAIFQNNLYNKQIVVTGSYNYTKNATYNNQENIVILYNKDIIEKFIKQFDIIKERSKYLTIKDKYTNKWTKTNNNYNNILKNLEKIFKAGVRYFKF